MRQLNLFYDMKHSWCIVEDEHMRSARKCKQQGTATFTNRTSNNLPELETNQTHSERNWWCVFLLLFVFLLFTFEPMSGACNFPLMHFISAATHCSVWESKELSCRAHSAVPCHLRLWSSPFIPVHFKIHCAASHEACIYIYVYRYLKKMYVYIYIYSIITLHYIRLHSITLHNIPFHCITLH